MVQQLLLGIKFKIDVHEEENGSLTLGMDDLELYAYGESEDQALDELVELIYTQQYMNDPDRYFHAPNRRHHFSYLFKVLMCNNKEEVKQMLLENAKLQKH